MGRHIRRIYYARIACFVSFFALALTGCDSQPQVATPSATPSATPLVALPSEVAISKPAYDLIVESEVTSESHYNRKLCYPEWPGGQSGITQGIGYDDGYVSKSVFLSDWNALDKKERLSQVVGLTGSKAKNSLSSVSDIFVSWELANEVFNRVDIPRYYQLTKRTFPGFENLCINAQGALVSLVYNRGNSLTGPSRIEMRNIKELVPRQDYRGIAANIRAMKRLWVGTGQDGLLERRDKEADLVLSCITR